MLPPTPVIVGPTAGGKSLLAVELALRLRERSIPAEIVTADAFQVYRGMDIGTAKPTAAEQRGVPHHLLDIADPREPFTVSRWLTLAQGLIADLRAAHTLPIVVGGTHLYIKSLLDGLFEGPGADPLFRAAATARDPQDLRRELEAKDPVTAARLHPNDIRRTVRALEVLHLTGRRISEHQTQWDRDEAAQSPRGPMLLVGLLWPAELINPRINARVKQMMADGLLEECRSLHAAGAFEQAPGADRNTAREALGYKQLIAHLEGRCSLDEAVEQTKIETRRFAKNQRTWLRRLRTTAGSLWIDAAARKPEDWPGMVLGALACASA